MMRFDWGYALEVIPPLLQGLVITIEATLLGMLIALTLGLVWAVARRAKFRVIRLPAAVIIEFIRSTPLLVQLYFLFYVLPRFGLSAPPFVTGVLALGLHYSTYTSEVYRAGIEGIRRGQWEAGKALGLTSRQVFGRIILPQAIPPVVPALGNYLVAMFKDTPLLSAITVLEMLQRAKILGSESFRYLEPFTMVGMLFLLVSLIAAAAVRSLERRLVIRG